MIEMDLVEKMRELMKKEFGIETDEDMRQAVEEQAVDIGIFVTPLKAGVENAS